MEVTLPRTPLHALAATVLACLFLIPGSAYAQGDADPPSAADVRAARDHYRRALRLYKQRAYESALVEFQKANEIAPSYRIHYNIAQVHQELGDYASAMRSLESYVADGGDELDADKRQRAGKEMETLRSKVASLIVRVNVEGAEVSVDDVVIGSSPVHKPYWVNRGNRKVRATYPGWVPAGKIVTAGGGDTLEAELILVDPKATTPPPVIIRTDSKPDEPKRAPQTPPPEEESSHTWVGWVATGALVTGAVVTGVLHLSAQSDLDDERSSLGADPQAKRDALDDAHARASKYAIATDIFAISAVMAGSITLYVTVQQEKQRSTQVGFGPGSVQLSGCF